MSRPGKYLSRKNVRALARHMEAKGLSAQSAAEQLGISRTHMYDLLAGKTLMRRAYGIALLHVLEKYTPSD